MIGLAYGPSIFLGKVRPFTSPRRGPSTGSDLTPPMSSEAEPSNGVRRVYPGTCFHEPPAAHKLVEGAGQLLLWINPSLKRKRDSRGCRGDNAALPVAGTVGLVFRATDACRAYARSGSRPRAKQGLVASVRSGVPTSPCGEVEEETALKPTPSLARHALSGLAGWLVLSGACRAQHYAGADTPSAVLSARRVEVGGAFERSVSRQRRCRSARRRSVARAGPSVRGRIVRRSGHRWRRHAADRV